MKVDKYAYFIRAAEAGTISRAAEQLNLAQPVLSRYIRDLEQEVGAALFERNGRGVSLTHDGQGLYLHAKSILDQIETAELEIASQDGPPLTAVKLGLAPWLSNVLAVPLANLVRRQMPRVALNLVEGPNSSLLKWLDQGIVDVAVGFYEFHPLHVLIEPISNHELYLVGAADSVALKSISDIPAQRVAELPMTLPPSPNPLRLQFESIANEAGRKLNILLETESAAIARDIVAAGMGFALVPEVARHALTARRLKTVRIVGPTLSQKLVIMRSLNRPPSTCQRELYRLVQQYLSQSPVEASAAA